MKTISADPAEARVLEILDEYLVALREGRAPDREALLALHPDLARSLAASFRALDFVHDAGRTLEAPEASPGPEDAASAVRTLGDYRLVREIGRGGMAVVYEAEQVSLGRHVALKVLPFAAVLDPKQLQRFKNEAQAAAHLHHPHIVPVHAVGCERGVHYYAMQYVEGQSLAVAIREMKGEGDLRPSEAGGRGAGEGTRTPISSHGSNREPAFIRMAAALGIQAAEALDHAHQLGIVHRDVKPGNLLVDHAGALWITDFGLAYSMKDVGLTITGELLGTIRYMSPEQALAKRVPVDHRTDVYSLGATLYELFTLEPAFPGEDAHLVIQAIASMEPVPPRRLNPALPRDLETVILKAMAKDPQGRYATAREMADDLGRFLENRPIEAKRPGLVRRASKWGRRHRALVSAAAGALLLAVAGLATGTALLWQEKRQTSREKEHTKVAFERAEANLALALRALDEIYLDEAEGNPRIREGLPRDLLERGLGFYEEFARENAYHQDVALLMGRAHLRASLIFVELGDKGRADEALDRAISTYREATRRWPEDSRPHSDLGMALGNRGDLDGAIRECSEAIRLEPDLAEAHNGLGIALKAKGDLDGAIREHREAIRLKQDYAWAHSNLGIALFDEGDLDGAIAAFRETIRLKPDYGWAHRNLGSALADKGDLDGAIREHRAAIRLKPNDAKAHNSFGRALAATDDHDGAILEYREAIRLEPDFADAHNGLGIALSRKGDSDEAMAEYCEAIRLKPDFAEAHRNLGIALLDEGDAHGAVREHREAIRLKPDLASAHNGLGCALASTGDRDGAILEYREAIRLKPDLAEPHYNLGLALSDKDLDGAILEYREAIRLKPGYTRAHINLGIALFDEGDLDEAIREQREAIRLEPNLAHGHNALGSALDANGDPDEAIREYREAIRLDPEFAAAHGNLGGALTRQGRFQEASRCLQKAYELGSKGPGWVYPSKEDVEAAKRKAEIEARLDEMLSGEARPRGALERIELAEILCAKSRHAESARMYAEAFAEDAALAEDPKGHRYNAACSASLATAGGGADAAEWRGRALEWLRADLAVLGRAPSDLVALLEYWRSDPDLASVRDHVDDLPAPEREGWRRFWADVDALLARAAEAK